MQCKFQILLNGSSPKRRDDISNDLLRTNLNEFDVESIGFDLRQVKYVVYQFQKMLAVSRDHLNCLLLVQF